MRANIEPMNNSFEIISDELYSIENIIIKIKEASNSIKSNEIKHFIQDLNIKEVECKDKVKIANGEIKIKTFNKTYLIEYRKIRFKKPTDTTVLIIPSIEKIFDECSSTSIIESEMSINLEKQMSKPSKSFPTSLIDTEIRLFRLISCVQKKKLQFIQIPINMSLIIN